MSLCVCVCWSASDAIRVKCFCVFSRARYVDWTAIVIKRRPLFREFSKVNCECLCSTCVIVQMFMARAWQLQVPVAIVSIRVTETNSQCFTFFVDCHLKWCRTCFNQVACFYLLSPFQCISMFCHWKNKQFSRRLFSRHQTWHKVAIRLFENVSERDQ